MKVRIAFTQEAKNRVVVFFEKNMRQEHIVLQACIDEAFMRACESESYSHYELGGFNSKSRNPEIIEFQASDFEYEEIND